MPEKIHARKIKENLRSTLSYLGPEKPRPINKVQKLVRRETVTKIFSLLIFSLNGIVANGQPTEEKSTISGFIDFNLYYDTRDFSVLTYNILANLPKRLQYFSLTNYQSLDRSFDLNSFYAEHNLRWAIHANKPLDLTMQYVIRDGEDNDDFRLGLRWRMNHAAKLSPFFKKMNFSYSVNPMFVQFRRNTPINYMTIIEHVYRIGIAPKKLNKRLYIGGFVDQNFEYHGQGGVSFNWVSEHQLGLRIVDELYLVLEYRINDFYPSENYGLGYGVEYKVLF